MSTTLPSSDVQQIITNAKTIGRPVALAGTRQIGANGIDDDLAEYFAISKQTIDIADDFEALAQDEIYQIMARSHQVQK